MLDAGQVATEVVYFLVGSRGLDGGLVCTASHNPKGYTGAKLLREGALALSGDAGIDRVRDLIEAGLPPAPGGGSVEPISCEDEFHDAVLSFVDAGPNPRTAARRRRRLARHGRVRPSGRFSSRSTST